MAMSPPKGLLAFWPSGRVGTDMCPVGGLSNDQILGSGMVDCFQGVIVWLGDIILVCYCIEC